jgi:ATP-dependent RNA helicase HelY
MAVNLVATYRRTKAERLLRASFAQFRDERRRGSIESDLTEMEARLAALRTQADCRRGDVWSIVEGHGQTVRQAAVEFASATAVGDVLDWAERGRRRRHVVVARGHGKRPRLLLVSDREDLSRISPQDLPPTVSIAGRIELPVPVRPREAGYRRVVAERLREWEPAGEPTGFRVPGDPPVLACPRLDEHLAAARNALRLERRIDRDRRRLTEASGGMVRRFGAILDVLEAWGYVRGWGLTESGERLRFIYNPLDLLVAESLARDLFADLDAAETAALASAFTFEPRGGEDGGDWPTATTGERADRVREMWLRLTDHEARSGLPTTRSPEAGFARTVYGWATGARLEDLFDDEAAEVGDFVRNCRQLLDLLRQMHDVAPGLVPAVDEAVAAIDRGVVIASIGPA